MSKCCFAVTDFHRDDFQLIFSHAHLKFSRCYSSVRGPCDRGLENVGVGLAEVVQDLAHLVLVRIAVFHQDRKFLDLCLEIVSQLCLIIRFGKRERETNDLIGYI